MIQFINSAATKSANLPFSQATRVGDIVYLSGAIGNAPGKMELVPGGIEAEGRQMMQNIAGVLKEEGLRERLQGRGLSRRYGRMGRVQ